ncbi:MAG: response regulator [Candidatus Hodarchaeota archaeon]
MERLFRILIADDDVDWANYCAKHLRKINKVNIELCYSVEDALQKIEENLYDLIICDYRMEYGDIRGISHFNGGFRICGKAKAYLPQVRVVMITAYGSTDLARESLVNEKFDDYFEKQIDPKVDIERIRQYIEEFINKWSEGPIATNPFLAQRGQIPRYLVSRLIDGKNHFEFFADYLRVAQGSKQARFLVLGRVGSGKSCLLSHYKNYAQKLGHFVSHYEIPPQLGKESVREATSELLIGIVRGFPKVGILDINNFVKSIKSLGGNVEVLGFKFQLQWQRNDASIETILRSGLTGIINDIKSKTEVIVIFLDNIRAEAPMSEALKYLLYVLSEESFVNEPLVVGASFLTKESNITRMVASMDPDLSRFFAGNIFQLSNFSREQVYDLATHTLAATGVTFEQNLIEKAYQYSNGYPFITQLLFNYLYDNEINGRVMEETFNNALQSCILEIGPFLHDFFGSLSENEDPITFLVASHENGLNFRDLNRVLLERDLAHLIPEVRDVCERLVQRDILTLDDNGKYRINFR